MESLSLNVLRDDSTHAAHMREYFNTPSHVPNYGFGGGFVARDASTSAVWKIKQGDEPGGDVAKIVIRNGVGRVLFLPGNMYNELAVRFTLKIRFHWLRDDYVKIDMFKIAPTPPKSDDVLDDKGPSDGAPANWHVDARTAEIIHNLKERLRDCLAARHLPG